MAIGNRIIILFAFGVAAVIWGCGSGKPTTPPTAQSAFDAARDLYMKGDYVEASQALDVVKLQYGGSSIADSTEFLLGECNFKTEQYLIAAYEFNTVRRIYTASPLARISQFDIAECYWHLSPNPGLDQEYTNRAIEEYQTFLEMYGVPRDSLVELANERIKILHAKLGEKCYNTANLYYKMDQYRAAVIYCDIVQDKYYDTPFADRASYLKIESLVELRRYVEANIEIRKFLTVYAASPLLPNVRGIEASIIDKISQ